MTVSGLGYAGNVTVTTPSGPTLAMRFTATSASIAALSIAAPCVAHEQWSPSVATAASASSGLTLDMLEFRGTVAGAPVDWTPDGAGATTIPPSPPIAGGAGTITGPITATLVGFAAPVLAMPGMTGSMHGC